MFKNLAAILVGSLGSIIMWLLVVPYLDTLDSSDGLVGFLGLERQFFGLLGTVAVGVWVDRGRVTGKFALLQGAQLALGLVLLVALLLSPRLPAEFILVWAGLRCILFGACAVLSFRMLSDLTGSRSRGAVYSMVTSAQGAMVFASVICVLVPLWSRQPFTVTVVIDCVSSALLTGFLLRRDRGGERESGSLAFRWRELGRSMRTAIQVYWIPQLRPWNWIQLCFLASLSGMMVYAHAIAVAQRHIPSAIAFASAWFFYGLAFWVTAPLLRDPGGARRWAVRSAVLLVACGVLAGLVGRSDVDVHAALYVVLAFVNAYWIHYSNVQIAERAPAETLGQVRASMLVYLGLVFGVGEQVIGLGLATGGGMSVVGWTRALGGLILLLGVLWVGKRSSLKDQFVPAGAPG
ncbi:hypothetical protein [Actinocrispum wychmicini]|uniref:MFS transporter n=1 Tax=Actinocrispum wychmicini TaxID=1213861 RepID=A0A4R2J5B6_9PSEU|nr:hypothetical protein [Actinocrispum wychmicini]TCO54041.1 hypothetical protein EV192_10921 [Actinocrispum wychmicini]